MKHRAAPSLTDLVVPLVREERLPVNGVLCRLEEQGYARETVRPALAEAWLDRWQAEGSLDRDEDPYLPAHRFLKGVQELGPPGAVCLPACIALLRRGSGEQQLRGTNHRIESVHEAVLAAGSASDVLAWLPEAVTRMEEAAPGMETATVIMMIDNTAEAIAKRLGREPSLRTPVHALAESFHVRGDLPGALAGNLLAQDGSDHPAAMGYVRSWAAGGFPATEGTVMGSLDQSMTPRAFSYRASGRLLDWVEQRLAHDSEPTEPVVLAGLTNLAVTGCMPGSDWAVGRSLQERACRVLAQVASRQ
jgi:hypothetical protein